MANTIEDVAKIANVSISTVSRVLNRRHLVNSATRQRVEKVIKQLNYSPNVYAQGLMIGRSDIPDLGTPYRTY
jgi:DNA-binding LacI/PurR family transcriptional regulator